MVSNTIYLDKLYTLESAVSKDASLRFSFSRQIVYKGFKKNFSLYSYVKIQPLIVTHPNTRDFDLNKESTLSENSSTTV